MQFSKKLNMMAGQMQFSYLFSCWHVVFLATTTLPEVSVYCFHCNTKEREDSSV